MTATGNATDRPLTAAQAGGLACIDCGISAPDAASPPMAPAGEPGLFRCANCPAAGAPSPTNRRQLFHYLHAAAVAVEDCQLGAGAESDGTGDRWQDRQEELRGIVRRLYEIGAEVAVEVAYDTEPNAAA